MDETVNEQPKRLGLVDFIWKKVINHGQYYDFTILFLVIFLFGFGLIMIYSSSSYRAALDYGNQAYFFTKQAIFGMIGLFVMLILSRVNYHIWKKLTILILFGTIILLGLVFVMGHAAGGATRWLSFGKITFQPSEFAKVTLILYLAYAINEKVWKLADITQLLKLMIWPAILIGLIATENLSTAIVCGIIMIAMLFVASPKYWHFFLIIGLVALVGTIFVLLKDYRRERFVIWQNIETHPKGFQTLQSMYAIGSGGLFGKGLGQSIQKMSYIPAGHNDMIFSIICEELGIVGGFILLLIFVLLIWRLMVITTNAKDLYGSLIAVGVLAHVATQVLINVFVVTNLIPNTGVPLPFISYGGTSLLGLMIEIGLVLSVSQHVKVRNR